jgi:RND family efflux transporter MFP subunit
VLTATGYLESRRQASVGANAPGRVEEIKFEEGTKVQKGDLLAVLEHSQLSAALASRQVAVEQAQAALAEMENVLAQDKRDLARARTLRLSQAVSEAELETAETAVRVSTVRVAAMTAALAGAKANVREAEVTIDNMHVYAPFSGTVVAKDAELGETILPGGMGAASGRGSVATIADLDHLDVDTDVKEDYLSQIEKGQPAEVIVDAVPQKRYRGQLREIIPMGDRSRGIVKVKVSVLDPDEKLFPDLSATVHFLPQDGPEVAASAKPAMYVPAAALLTRDGKTMVWRLNAEQQVDGVAVTVKARQQDGLVTVEGQLEGGDTVIVDPPPEIAEGVRVRTAE